MSAPICAGPICRCPAASSRCCGGLSICQATPRHPAQASPALFLIDAVIVALLGAGIAALLRRRAVSAALALALALSTVLATPSSLRADSNDDFAIKAVSQTRLAYVVTGNADVDSIVKAGMSGLTLFLAQRTALEAGDPVGIDPAHAELAFFPLMYWSAVPGAEKPPQDH